MDIHSITKAQGFVIKSNVCGIISSELTINKKWRLTSLSYFKTESEPDFPTRALRKTLKSCLLLHSTADVLCLW